MPERATEDSALSDQIDDIVDAVKRAVLEVAKDTQAGGAQIAVKQVDLTLNLVTEKDAGGNLKFKLFGHSLGLAGRRTSADTQTIAITFSPRTASAMTFGAADLSDKLVSAVRAIRDSVAVAVATRPRFVLTESSVELNFKVDKRGNIDFLVTGEASTANVQTVKITFGPA